MLACSSPVEAASQRPAPSCCETSDSSEAAGTLMWSCLCCSTAVSRETTPRGNTRSADTSQWDSEGWKELSRFCAGLELGRIIHTNGKEWDCRSSLLPIYLQPAHHQHLLQALLASQMVLAQMQPPLSSSYKGRELEEISVVKPGFHTCTKMGDKVKSNWCWQHVRGSTKPSVEPAGWRAKCSADSDPNPLEGA